MTTPDDAAAIALTVFEAWNANDFERARAVLAPDFTATEVGTGQTYGGADGLRHEFDLWRAALPDGRIDVTTVVASGEHVVIESVVRGTHDGPFATKDGLIPASGRSIELPMCTIVRVKDNQYCANRHYFDSDALFVQLGART